MLSRQVKFAFNRLLGLFGFRIQRVDPAGSAAQQLESDDPLLSLLFDQLIEQLHRRIQSSEFFFIQVGAFDGLTNDPLHAYIRRYGWRGVLVEPQEEPFQALLENYRGHDQLAFLNAAIGGRDGQSELFVVRKEAGQPAWSQQIASFRPEVVMKHDHNNLAVQVPRGIQNLAEIMKPRLVETVTFGTLIERYAIGRIDLLQIDAEGYDGALLRLFDFDRLQPAIVRYEHVHLSMEEQSACLELLLRRGYRFTVGTAETLAYRI
jgi:FkbM family methyltransferase